MSIFTKYGKKSSKLLIAVCMMMIVSLTTGCGNDTADQKEETGKKSDKIQIGMSFDSFVIERWQRDRDVFVATARELGAEVNVQSANGEIEEQISQIQYFINKGVDAIVVVGVEGHFQFGAIGVAVQMPEHT